MHNEGAQGAHNEPFEPWLLSLGLFPVYHHIRLKYEDALFTDFGGVSRVSRVMKTPGKVNAFMCNNF
jgi:hypothetical protein